MNFQLRIILPFLAPVLVAAGPISFTDVTESAGIDWEHVNGATPEKYLIETMGGGGAFLDYDNDGWLDIYLVNSGGHAYSAPGTSGSNALYKNQRDGTFVDVTLRAGVAGRGFGNGVAVADFDNDGFQDLFVTAFGRNILYRNRGNGTFEEVTSRAGVELDSWSTSAAFFDADSDGDLDLFVCVYLEWSYGRNVWCGDQTAEGRSYCDPEFFTSRPSHFYRNNGDGTFTDATREAGLRLPGKALGVVAADFDLDGDTDLYVTNHSLPNFLYLNRGQGEFSENGLVADVAYGPEALPEASVGTDAGDFNNDGRPDLVVSNIDDQPNVHVNLGGAFFGAGLGSAELAKPGRQKNGFGTRLLDLDLDGALDIVVLRGHPLDNVGLYQEGVENRQTPLILRNDGTSFSKLAESGGAAMERKYAGRALASGDFDNDGDPDLLFVNNGEAPALLRNDTSSDSWFGLRLIGTRSNRSAIGTRVTLETSRRTLVREVTGGGSYQAAHDSRIVFGLELGEAIRKLEIRWPDGQTRELPRLRLGRYHTVRE